MRRLVVLVVAVAAFLPGCGGGGEGPRDTPQQVVGATQAKTAEAGSSRMVTTVVGRGGAAGSFRFTSEGTYDYRGQRGELSFRLPEVGKAELRLLGTVIYVKLPPEAAAELPANKPWIKIELERLGQLSGIDIGALLRQFQGADPTTTLNVLGGVRGEIRVVGDEQVRGAATTHYSMTVNFDQAIARAPEDSRQALEKVAEQLLTRDVPTDVWVDYDGRLRQLRQRVELAAGQGQATTTMELYDFGVEVDVNEPPAGQVTDIADLLGSEVEG